MEYKKNEVKAGVFITLSFVIFIAFLMIIMGIDAFDDKNEYRARFEYVGGVEPGSAVRYAGIQVGAVTGVSLVSEGGVGAEVTFEVDKSTPLKENSVAYLTTVGILGSPYLEVSLGTPDAAPLPPGSLMQSKDVTGFAQMTEDASDLLAYMNNTMVNLNELLSPENKKYFTEILQSTREISVYTAENMQTIVENVNALVMDTQATINAVQTGIAKNDTLLSSSLQQVDGLLAETRSAVDNLNILMHDVGSTINTSRPQLETVLQNLHSTSTHLDELTRSIKEQPWTVIRKNYPDARDVSDFE